MRRIHTSPVAAAASAVLAALLLGSCGGDPPERSAGETRDARETEPKTASTEPCTGGPEAEDKPQPTADHPHARGPAPTRKRLEAEEGPFAVGETEVSREDVGRRFGGGTVYCPAAADRMTFAGVTFTPGHGAERSSFIWFAEQLASHGFVVIVIDTKELSDYPAERADQMLAALDYLAEHSAARELTDPERSGVLGHSMGGGGSLQAAAKRPELRGVVALEPWHQDTGWASDVRAPSLVIGGENDDVAPVSEHAKPFYEQLTDTSDKAYLELRDADHFVPFRHSPAISRTTVAWLKRHLDDDPRYTRFLCPAPGPDREIKEYRDTC